MSSIKYAIYNLMKALAITPADNIHHRELPQNPSYPAAVYDIISMEPVDLTYDVGVVGFRKARVQIDVYALSFAEAEAAIEAYFEELKSFSAMLSDGFSPATTYDVDIWDEGRNPDMSFTEQPTLRRVEGRSHDFMIHF